MNFKNLISVYFKKNPVIIWGSVLFLILGSGRVNAQPPACGTNLSIRIPCSNDCPLSIISNDNPLLHHCFKDIDEAQEKLYGKVRIGFLKGLGPLGDILNEIAANYMAGVFPAVYPVEPASNKLARALSVVIGIITIIAAIWFLIQILIAGFNMITSSGDKNKLQEAQHKITNSIIGITVVVAAYAITSLFGKILGIPNLLNIGAIIRQLGPY